MSILGRTYLDLFDNGVFQVEIVIGFKVKNSSRAQNVDIVTIQTDFSCEFCKSINHTRLFGKGTNDASLSSPLVDEKRRKSGMRRPERK